MSKKYVFKPYSKYFPKLFLQEKTRILKAIGKTCIDIQHVGSTAIAGLGGKGIIDIAIAVDQKQMQNVSKMLVDLGYEFRKSFSTKDRLYFVIYLPDLEEKKRRYHIHLTFLNSKPWQELIFFRDYLCDHPKEAKRYADLKKYAALKSEGDGKVYKKLKEPMFKKVQNELNNRKR